MAKERVGLGDLVEYKWGCSPIRRGVIMATGRHPLVSNGCVRIRGFAIDSKYIRKVIKKKFLKKHEIKYFQ